jgi:hypothetical protein
MVILSGLVNNMRSMRSPVVTKSPKTIEVGRTSHEE